MVVLVISRKLAMDKLDDSEMVVNDEEDGCRSKTKGKKHGSTHNLCGDPTRNLNTYLSCHTLFTLSSVQILLIPACCLLCVL